MDGLRYIQALLLDDPLRHAALIEVSRLNLPDGWIAAGFVRDAVWDDRHGYGVCRPHGDVDVVYFEATQTSEEQDRAIEDVLRSRMPDLAWSVKNQARMHLRNGDAPYADATDAMRYWPETATAIAARWSSAGTVDVAAPFGTTDLMSMRLCPAPAFTREKLRTFDQRVREKRCVERYPLLEVVRPCDRAQTRCAGTS